MAATGLVTGDRTLHHRVTSDTRRRMFEFGEKFGAELMALVEEAMMQASSEFKSYCSVNLNKWQPEVTGMTVDAVQDLGARWLAWELTKQYIDTELTQQTLKLTWRFDLPKRKAE